MPIKIPTEQIHLGHGKPIEQVGQEKLTKQVKLAQNDKELIAGISAFGFSGTNVHVILSQPPSAQTSVSVFKESIKEKIKQIFTLTISAKNPSTLLAYCRDYIRFLNAIDDNPQYLADICYTAKTGRTLFDYRCAITGKNRTDLMEALEKFITDKEFVLSGSLDKNVDLKKSVNSSDLSDLSDSDEKANRKKVLIPTYPFQRKRFWMNPLPIQTVQISEQESQISNKILQQQTIQQPKILGTTKIVEFNRNYPSFIPEHIIYGEPIVPACISFSTFFVFKDSKFKR